jgi:hypothetical protein
MARQWNPRLLRAHRWPEFSILDSLNQIQVDDRAHATPQALLSELRAVGPRAITNRRRIPSALRAIRLPMPALGIAPIGYLTDLIYTRDMWIHRLDIARATEREMTVDALHDARIVALMVSDLGNRLRRRLAGRAVLLDLTGPAGGPYRIGLARQPSASMRLDALSFAWLTAGRLTADAARAQAVVDGDSNLAARVIENAAVPV